MGIIANYLYIFNLSNKTLDEDYVLKGIKNRSEFGFLTIFEHYKYMEVGSFLKTPYYPIWIICKEYHYSVIFGTDDRVLMENTVIGNLISTVIYIFTDNSLQ